MIAERTQSPSCRRWSAARGGKGFGVGEAEARGGEGDGEAEARRSEGGSGLHEKAHSSEKKAEPTRLC